MTNYDFLISGDKWDASSLLNLGFNFAAETPWYTYLNLGFYNNYEVLGDDGVEFSGYGDTSYFDHKDTIRFLLAAPANLSSYSESDAINSQLIDSVEYRVSFSDVIISSFSEEIEGEIQLVSHQGLTSSTPSIGFYPGANDISGDIVINYLDPVYNQLAPGQAGFWLLLHELGHAVGGLEDVHSTAQANSAFDSHKYTMMSYTGHNGVAASGLQLLDIVAIQDTYAQRNYGTRADNTTYALGQGLGFAGASETNPFLYTIWDGGGTADTIDTSGFSDGVTIDLRQGAFSSIGVNGFGGDAVDNVAIAYYTVIENAVGTNDAVGAGDILIGNAWNNKLIGGAGDDKIYGDGFVYDGDAGFREVDPYRNWNLDNPAPARDGSGNDILDGGAGSDWLYGGAGDDLLIGGEGYDYLYGGLGDDIFVGGEGGDWFYGGNGRDTVDYGQEEAAGGTFDVRVMNVDDFSADVRVFDTYGYIDNMRDVETIVLTGGNDTVIYSHAVIPNVLTINGGDGDDSFTLSADTSFGYVQRSGDTWNFYDSYGGNDYKLTLLNFENVYFSSSEDQQISAVILPDLGQSILNPINVFVSEGGNSSFSGTIDYTASSSGGSFHFGNGSQNNTAHVGGVTHIMKTPSVIYMPDHHNSIIVEDESTLGTIYTGTASDTINLYTTQPVIYYSGGNDTYYMNAGYNQVRMTGNLTSDNIFSVQSELFGETQSHITVAMDVGFLNLYVPYLSYGNHYSIELGQGYMDIVGGLNGEVTYQLVGSTDTPSADFGTWSDDTVRGGDYSDYLTGSGGNDTLYGGNNADNLYGGDGDDILYGDSGDDYLYGGFGNDTLSGGAGNDVLRGGWGDDVYVFTPGGGVEDIFDYDGYNTLKIKGGVPPENVTFVQSGNDLLINVASGVILRGYYSGTTSISEIIFENDAGEVTHTYTVEAMLNGEHLASNVAPIAQDDAFTALEGQTVTGNVLDANGHGADSDADNDPLTVVPAEIVTAGGGSVLLLSNGDFIYTPLENFNGADSFTYTLEDGQGGSDTGTVFLNMTPVNDGPEARDDRFTGTENIEIEGNLLADNGFGADFDLEGDQLRVVQDMVTSAAGGSVILMHNGDFVYMPPANFYGEDSFTYTVSDGNGGEATATAFITLEPGNLAPVALNDYDSGFLLGTIGGNVLADNGQGADYDPDGDPLSVMPEGFMTANGGLVMLQANGDYTYTPVAGFTGTDSFTYTLIDGQGGSAVATVNLSVGLRGNEITGSERGDFILGTQQSDVILAKGGNDFVLGRQSADKILGGAGKDFIHGQNGDDLLIGGAGSDQLYGGNGNDILIGDDVLIIGSGAGTRYMQAGSGGEGDCLDGGNGNDLLIGGAGNDTLTGGNGADVFKFLSGANGKDKITDFDAREGDKIDISDVLEGGYDPLADMISQFAKIEKQGHSYTLSIDADGADNGAHFTAIAVIDSNRHLSLESMIQNESLIV